MSIQENVLGVEGKTYFPRFWRGNNYVVSIFQYKHKKSDSNKNHK